jgi:hypothetical protein
MEDVMNGRTKFRDIEFKGSRTMVDETTGEVVQCQSAVVHDKDFNFQKFWLANALAAVDELSNKRMKVVMFLMAESMKRSNMIALTVREIATAVGCSPTIVQETLTVLYKHDILRNKGRGVRFFNPDVIWKGSAGRRHAVIFEYEMAGRKEEPEPKRIEHDISVLVEEVVG